ncbi:MAG: hypothetical protein OWR52_10420 [Acidibacillus sp.]|uniref:Transmembrane protein n=1 Tax=Sulfoacidibacillus ferrooxidans TaxID=2005001 RepID=A0A9X1V904_9BACL|nr:hypothetical protein [Sulfoacidibacillus ferrooxidans]MCI0182278.1 hypothetical protein [Sulfoacidibacillus ferrooxidans]MCY0893908.1 hypothetical protein [Acidibacillus sp.]
MGNNFWPTLPIKIPYSEGMPLWWDIVFWIFQAVVMTTLVLLLIRWATRIDHIREQEDSLDATIPSKKGR